MGHIFLKNFPIFLIRFLLFLIRFRFSEKKNFKLLVCWSDSLFFEPFPHMFGLFPVLNSQFVNLFPTYQIMGLKRDSSKWPFMQCHINNATFINFIKVLRKKGTVIR